MSEGGAGGEGFGGEGYDDTGYGIEAAIASIEAAAPGSISMGLEDTAGTPFEGGAAGDLGSGISLSAPAQNPTMGLGTGITPGTVGESSRAAASDLGMGALEGPSGSDMGGESGIAAPPMEKPRGVSVAEEVRADAAERLARRSQRAAAASVTRNDNDAYLLGYVSPKRKDARRVLLGA